MRKLEDRGGPAQPLLIVDGLRKHFPLKRPMLDGGPRPVVRAVDDVSFTLPKGGTLGVVGESGCGKSTLGRALLRLEPITRGRLVAFGEDITERAERHLRTLRRRTAMIFQDPHASLDPRMTVGQSVAEPLRVHKVGDRAARQARVEALFDRVGLPREAIDRPPHAFSGGQLQRIGIARALALDPAVVVADEPVSALDVSVQAGVINLLTELQAERKLAYVFVAHDLKVVELFSHRVAVMYLGRVVEQAPAAELFADPRHPYTQALLAAAPVPDPTRRADAPPLIGEPPSPLAPPPGCAFHPRCPMAEAQCRTTPPTLRADANGHATACHLVTIEPPRALPQSQQSVDARGTPTPAIS
ncbi:MAG: ATP-binding cassette domain-containing protein [Myxococcales bacterium]|nr:ATP-binding cassette domain-containing protein [Myxococcales bacterium]